jgi:hypothetical protein
MFHSFFSGWIPIGQGMPHIAEHFSAVGFAESGADRLTKLDLQMVVNAMLYVLVWIARV